MTEIFFRKRIYSGTNSTRKRGTRGNNSSQIEKHQVQIKCLLNCVKP